MAFKLSARSLKNLEGVKPQLVAVVKRAIELTEVDFVVTEGLRTRERQKVLVAQGASRTMNSKHLTGDAVDLAAWVEGAVRWHAPLYHKLNDAMQKAAAELGVKIRWGGTFRNFFDGPHWELV
jgi:hypothetical protein